VATNLEAIEQFYDRHRARQRPLLLESPERRMMRLPAYTGPMVESADEIDLDSVAPDPINMVSSLLRGDASGLVEFITGSSARTARKELDRALAGLYQIYAAQRDADDGRASPLERSAAEWDAEAMRLVRMASDRSWADEPWADCADALVAEAQQLARTLADKSRDNVRSVLDRIDYLGERRDEAAAGHLVYVNRERLLPRRTPEVDRQLAAIEEAGRKLQAELASD
jgi:hypothetical protein